MNASRVWLQVNINIGSRSLKIDVRKGQSMEQVVRQFIAEHNLSEQYQPIIVNMIKQQVKLKLAQQSTEQEPQHQHAHPSTPPPLPLRNESQSQSPPTNKHSQKSTALVKGTNTKSQLMAEMMRIKEEVDRKKEQELSRVRSRERYAEDDTEENSRFQTVKQSYHQSGYQSNQSNEAPKKTVKGNQNGGYYGESKKNKIFRKIEEQKEKLGLPSSISQTPTSFHHKTEHSEVQQSILKDDIVELKGLLNKTQGAKKTVHKKNSPKKQENHPSFVNKKSIYQEKPEQAKSREALKSARHQPAQQTKLEQVYNKWKKLEQNRKTQQSLKKLSSTPRPKKLQKHPDSFFYEKGKSFLQEKHKKNEESFRRIYPFKRTNTSITPEKINVKAVTQRLHQEARSKSIKKMEVETHKTLKLEQQKHTPRLKPDPIREKVRRRDMQYDQAISQLIEEGKIQNPNKIQNKSPNSFRRVQAF